MDSLNDGALVNSKRRTAITSSFRKLERIPFLRYDETAIWIRKRSTIASRLYIGGSPETAEHIQATIDEGLSNTCTIDRGGADENRQESLRGISTKCGYDRDEWPIAMCAEGGEGASIEYIDPSDNRGAGRTRVEFIFN